MAFVPPPTAQVVSRADSRLDRVGWTALEYAPFRYFIVVDAVRDERDLRLQRGARLVRPRGDRLGGGRRPGLLGLRAADPAAHATGGCPDRSVRFPGDAHRELRRTRRRGRALRPRSPSAPRRHSRVLLVLAAPVRDRRDHRRAGDDGDRQRPRPAVGCFERDGPQLPAHERRPDHRRAVEWLDPGRRSRRRSPSSSRRSCSRSPVATLFLVRTTSGASTRGPGAHRVPRPDHGGVPLRRSATRRSAC